MFDLIDQNPALYFPIFFIGMWLAVSFILSLLSGWVFLTATFQDRPEVPLLRMSGQSGSMGLGVNMQGILALSACPSGIRIGILRIFGPFCSPLFVPWESLEVVRRKGLIRPVATLKFGTVGRLTIPAYVADRLANAAPGRWPEAGPFRKETRADLGLRLAKEWAIMTGVTALFFLFGPRLLTFFLALMIYGQQPVAPVKQAIPTAEAILFPAILFGLVALVKFLRSRAAYPPSSK